MNALLVQPSSKSFKFPKREQTYFSGKQKEIRNKQVGVRKKDERFGAMSQSHTQCLDVTTNSIHKGNQERQPVCHDTANNAPFLLHKPSSLLPAPASSVQPAWAWPPTSTTRMFLMEQVKIRETHQDPWRFGCSAGALPGINIETPLADY